MNIVVLVKQVPDSGGERHLTEASKTVDRTTGNLVINELDENALEAALTLQAEHGGEVTVLTVGPDAATEAIRKALQFGPDKAIHINDAAIAGSCAVTTSKVLAAALSTVQWDLVISGVASTDGQVGAVPAMLSERLGVAQVTGARKVSVEGSTVTIERQTEDGYQVVEAQTPAIVSVWDNANEPRYPSFKGIMAAKKKPITVMSLADLNIDPATVGSAAATSEVVEFTARPPKQAGVKVADDGTGGTQLVEFLAAQKFV